MREIELAAERDRCLNGFAETREEPVAHDFPGAHPQGVVRGLLDVEQAEPSRGQVGDERDQSDFRSVAYPVKHRLPREVASHAHPVQAADKLPSLPDLDAVSMPLRVQLAVHACHAGSDPRVTAAGPRRRTAGHHVGKAAVTGHLKLPTADPPRQTAQHMDVCQLDDRAGRGRTMPGSRARGR